MEGNTCCFKELACVQNFKEVISKSEVVNTCSANMCIEHDYVCAWRLRIGKSIFHKMFTQIKPIYKHLNYGSRFGGHSVW